MYIELAESQDADKWNNIVEKDKNGLFFDKYEWCQALGKISNNNKPLPFFIKENDEIIGIFPSCLIKKGFYLGLESLPFSDYGGGPFFRRNDTENDSELIVSLIGNLIKFAIKNNCIKISIRRGYYSNLIKENYFDKKIITESNNCSFIIDLGQGVKEVFKNLKSSRKKSIKKAEKKDIYVREVFDKDDLNIFYNLYVNNMNRLKSIPYPYDVLDYIWDNFILNDEAKMFISESKNEPIGGLLLFHYKGICHGWSCGVLEKHRDKSPMDLLIWHSMKWAFERNLHFYDLGSTRNDPSSGHYFYKNSWGGEKKGLYNYHILIQPKKWHIYNFINNVNARLVHY